MSSEYEKIQMVGNEGSFVKTLQGKTGAGFGEGFHVHRDWLAQCLTYDQGFELLEQAKSEREDLMVPISAIKAKLDQNGKFVVSVNSGNYTPTEYAYVQSSKQFKIKSSTILREIAEDEESDAQDNALMVCIMENYLRKMDQDKVYRLRTYKDGTLRAVLTDLYAPIDNRWYLEVLQEIIPDGLLSHWKGDEDTIYGNILIPDSVMDYGTNESDYGGMVSIGNCEIGKRRVSQTPSIFRSICLNGCIWNRIMGKDMISKKHMGKIDLAELKHDIRQNIEKQIPLIPQGINKFLELRTLRIKDVPLLNTVAQVCLEGKLSKTEALTTLEMFGKYEKDEKSMFGIVNGMTRASQSKKLNAESWLKLDTYAGECIGMTDNKWKNILNQAAHLDEKDIEKVFKAA